MWIRDGNHEGPGGYDSFKVADFLVTIPAPAPVNQPPIANSLVPDKASPKNAGTSIVWTAGATDPESDTMLY
ncbi:MAG TPA: hypothetical protein HA349_00915, partial [Methanotrichaceae archaeon]|nr:hypothetical protein [Methanotrichaceae archaeon]